MENCHQTPWIISEISHSAYHFGRKLRILLIGPLFRTLYKIHTFVEAQQKNGKVKNFFRQGEMSTLLKECKAGLQQGFDLFQVGDAFGLSVAQ
jgi:hypothetical protein